MNIAAILAAGYGRRMGTNTPKQFTEIDGKPILAHTLEAFQSHLSIDIITVVAKKDYFPVIEDIKRRYNITKLKKIIEGGSERYISSYNAVKECECDDDNLLIHDAARPNVSHRIIDDLLLALNECNAATVAIPATDTIYMTDNSCNHIISIPDRKQLMHAQTPQAFKVSTIKAAFAKALADDTFTPTDDASIVIHYLPDEIVRIVKGETGNYKITYPSDLTR